MIVFVGYGCKNPEKNNNKSLELRIGELADSLINKEISSKKAIGVNIAVALGDSIIFSKSYGQSDVELNHVSHIGTVFDIASISKQFTAVAIMDLVAKGKLNLGDPISLYIPEYPETGKDIKIINLLNHTSGIPNFTDINVFEDSLLYQRNLTNIDMLNLFAYRPLEFTPGNKFSYNNSGYYLLGEIIKRISGSSYEDYLKINFFIPHNLNSIQVSNYSTIIPHRAKKYILNNGNIEHAPYHLLSSFSPSTGGLCSNVTDLIKWNYLLYNNKILSSDGLKKMLKFTALNDSSKIPYGYGLKFDVLNNREKIYHDGDRFGVSARLAYYPENQLSIVILANTHSFNKNLVEQAIAMEFFGSSIRDLPISISESDKYVGKYTFYPPGPEDSIHVNIGRQKDHLHFWVKDEDIKLLYQGDNIFIAENDLRFHVLFKVSSQGGIDSVYVKKGKTTISGKKLK